MYLPAKKPTDSRRPRNLIKVIAANSAEIAFQAISDFPYVKKMGGDAGLNLALWSTHLAHL